MKKTFLLVLFFVYTLFPAVSSRYYTTPEQQVWPEAPSAARLRQVTMPTPALATGAATFDVPLWTLKVDDLEIPFSLRYHSNGIRIEDDPYPVGYGWTFLPALRVTRHVLGRPDGGKYAFIGEDYNFIGERISGSPPEYRVKYGSMVKRDALGTYTGYDAERDIFTVHLPWTTFNAYYKDGALHSPGRGEYRIGCTQNIYGIASVTVTDPQGRVWNFATPGKSWNSEALSEWALTSVTLPTGRKILFKWTSGSHMPDIGQAYSHYFIYAPYQGIAPPGMGDSGNINHSVSPGGCMMNLTEVVFPGGSVTLSYNEDGRGMLESMAISGADKLIEKITFTHGSVDTDRTMLMSVVFANGEKYGFRYDPGRFTGSAIRDYWGFNKGGVKNGSADVPDLLFRNLGGYLSSHRFYGYDRRPDATAMRAMILTGATYPTGGTVEWEYEPHEFDGVDFVDSYLRGNVTVTHDGKLTYGGGLRVRKITLRRDAADPDPRTVTYVYGSNGDGKAIVESYPTLSTFISDALSISTPSPNGQMEPVEQGRLVLNVNSNYDSYSFGDPCIWYGEVTEIHSEGKTVHGFTKPYPRTSISRGSMERFHPVALTGVFAEGPVETSVEVWSGTGTNAEKVSGTTRAYSIMPAGSALSSLFIWRKIYFNLGNAGDPDMSVEQLHAEYGKTVDDCYSLGEKIYGVFIYQLAAGVYPLRSETRTDYTSTGEVRRRREVSYVSGTGLVSEERISDGTSTLVTTYGYPENSTGVSQQMWNANLRGVVTGITTTFGGMTERIAYYYAKKNATLFRPDSVTYSRGTARARASVTYRWNGSGNLVSMTDKAGVSTAWAWDETGQYPLTQTVAGSLTAKATWKPLVGVASLTDPAGLVSSFEYDSGNRLSRTTVGGRTMVTYTYVINQNGNNSMTTRPYTAADIAEPTIERIDGLGRTWGIFSKHSSGTTASLTEYDAMGRPFRRWAPTPVGSTSLSADAVRTAAVDAWGATPYDETAYEASPRGMPQTVTRAGAAWHNSGKKTVTAIHANDAKTYACPLYTVTSDGVSTSGNWPDGTLLIQVTEDEDGMRTETYTDMRGLTVRVKRGTTATDYVYDGYGDLRYVLPPGVSGTRKRTDSQMKSLAYWYDYSNRGLLLMRKLPGCREEYFRYDDADRLVAEKTRDLPSGTWRLYAYDKAGRQVLAIDCKISDANVLEYAKTPRTAMLKTGGSHAGYDIQPATSVIPGDKAVVWANYYDSHDFIDILGLDADFKYIHPFTGLGLSGRAAGSQYAVANSPGSAKGKLTGVYTGEGYESIYYDSRGQELERHSTGFGRGWTVTFHTYDGQPLSVHRVYGKYNGGKLPDRDTYYSYDPGGRVVKVRHVERIRPSGSTTERVDSAVISTEWNPLGQVGAVRLGTGARRTIGYDVHGWVRATGTSTRSGEFYEYIRYADDAAKPRYNGFISRRQWGKLNGFSHTYDYTYDGNGFLKQAQHADGMYTVGYAYDDRGNIVSMRRMGVTDMLRDGIPGGYGVLDDIAASYSGNQLTGLGVTSGAKTFSRRTGIGRTGGFTLAYDDAGRLSRDGSRDISSIRYDNGGHPSLVTFGNLSTVSYRRDGLGNLLETVYSERSGGTASVPTFRLGEHREYTSGGHVISNGRLVMSRFGGGYFDGSGNPHYYVTDWQGNNIGVVDRNGLLEQRTDYYPYGEPWIEPEATMSGQGSVVIRPGLPVSAEEGAQDIEATAASSSGSDASVNVFLFGDKERTRSGGLNEYRFPARDYVPGFPRFATIDPMCEKTPGLSPYAYCAGNPVMYVDPNGTEVRGASRADAKKIVEDLHEIFRAETFEKFRSLITNKGARIAKISEYDLAAAFEGVQLSEDQQALVDIVFNTINSKDKHVVEYLKSDGNMSSKAADAFSSEFEKLGISMTATAAHYGGIPSFIIAPLGAEGLTTPTSNGTYSVIYDNKELYLLGRSVTTGHELFGHGRSLANGRNATQNIDAIQTENLILRVMGIDFIRDGIDHGLNIKSPTTLIPSFR